MAENNVEIEQIKQATSADADKLLKGIAGKQDPFAGYDLRELLSAIAHISAFEDSNAKEQLLSKLNDAIDKINSRQNLDLDNNLTQAQAAPQTPTDSQTKGEGEELPSAEFILPSEEFMTEPSYSQYKEFGKLLSEARKGNNNLSNEDIIKMTNIINNAQKYVDLLADKEITPENAVVLKDYINILRDGKTFEAAEKEKFDALESKVDEQLKVFDEENGLDKLQGISAEELKTKENTLYKIADTRIQDKIENSEFSDSKTEDYKILMHLVVQEMKTSPFYPSDELLHEYAQSAGLTYTEVKAIFDNHNKDIQLGDKEQEIYNALLTREFDQRFEELLNQLEIAKAIERAKLSAAEEYPLNENMNDEEIARIEKLRKEYIEKWYENGAKDEAKWLEERALRALRKEFSSDTDNELSDKDFISAHQERYNELHSGYKKACNEFSEAAKYAYVLKIDMLANRTARLTNSDDINPQTKGFLEDFSKNNPKTYMAGKIALGIGKSFAISTGLKFAFGFKGMAINSAYNTQKAVKRSWNKYKEQAKADGKGTNFAGFWGYLKDNPNERITIISGLSKTAIQSTLAVAGTVTGFDNVPGLSAALVGSVTTIATTAKVIANKEKIKDFARNNIKKRNWKKTGYIVGGAVILAGVAYSLLPDDWKEKLSELKEKIEHLGIGKDDAEDEAVNDTVDNTQNTNTDVVENASDTVKGISLDGEKTVEGTSLDGFKKPVNLFGDNSLNQPLFAEVKGAGLGQDAVHIGAEAPKLDDVAGTGTGGNAADAAQATTDYTNFELFADETTKANIEHFVGYPKFSADKLHELGLIDKETADELSSVGGTRKTLAKLHELDENATPEQKAKLAEYKEWINDKGARQAEINQYEHLKKVQKMAAERAAAGKGGDGVIGNDVSDKSVQGIAKAPEEKLVRINTGTNKAFAGIITKHGEVGVQEVASTGNPSLDQVNAAIEQHSATGGKHIDTSITNENGEVVSKGRFTVKEKDGGYSVKGKLQHGDIKEKIKVEGNTKISTFKGMEASDKDGDGKSEKVVGVATDGKHTYTAVKMSGGEKVIIDDTGNKHAVKGGLKRVLKNLVQKGR